jgi:hypothetical protein
MSASPRRVVVCEYAASALREGELALFPTESSVSPAAFSQEELRRLSPAYSVLYVRLIDALVPLLEAEGLPAPAARTFLRDAVPTVAHFSLDRALRLDRLTARLGADGLSVRTAFSRPLAFARASQLRAAASGSREHNESVLGRLAPALGLGLVEGAPEPLEPEPPASPPYRNYNFEGRSTADKLRGRAYRLLGRLWPGRAPALSLAYATFVLQDKGFFGRGGLEFVSGRVPLADAAQLPGRRVALRSALLERLPLLEGFLREAGARAAGPLAGACAGLMTELFPADSWEGAPAHHAAASRLLDRFDAGTLTLTETGNIEATALIAAARGRGMRTLGVQDGGHYGYMDDVVAVVEGEFPHFDRYVTWGWERFPGDAAGLAGVTAVPKPSPWLSEKRRQWRAVCGPRWWEAPRPHDLLLMSNRVYPFPPAPSGAAVSRSDHAPAFAAELRGFVREASAAGLYVLHKSYNVTTRRLLSRTLEELGRAAGGRYAAVERADKGLHEGLVGLARMVVWDQPGTGYLECLVAGIPTMALWSRLYNREDERARPYFAALERAGLVHREPGPLLAEYARFKAAPTAWMEDEGRRDAVRSFLDAYAKVDDDWDRAWRPLLREACSRR